MLRRKRGRMVRSSKAERLRAVVNSSMAPASINSQWLWGRLALAPGFVVVEIDGVHLLTLLILDWRGKFPYFKGWRGFRQG